MMHPQESQTHKTWDDARSPDSREEFQELFDSYWEKRYGLSQKTALFFMLTMVSCGLVIDPPHSFCASVATSVELTIMAISIIIFNIKDSQKEMCVYVAYLAVLTQIIFEDIGNANTCGAHNRFFTGYLIFLMFGNIFLHVKYQSYRKIVLMSMIMWNVGMFLVLCDSPLVNPILEFERYGGDHGSDYFEMDIHKWFWSFTALCFVAMSCIQSTQKREISRRFMFLKILKDREWFEKEKKRKLKKQRRKNRKNLKGKQGRYSDDPDHDSSINGSNSDSSSSSESDIVMDDTLNAFTWHSNKGIGHTIDYITAIEHQMFNPPMLERDAGSKAANSSGNNSTKSTKLSHDHMHVELKNENSDHDYKTNEFQSISNQNTNYHVESKFRGTNTSHHRTTAVAETDMVEMINLNSTILNNDNNNHNIDSNINGHDDNRDKNENIYSGHKRHKKHLDEVVFDVSSALQLVKSQDIVESNVDNRFLRFFKLIGIASCHVTSKHDRNGSIVKDNGFDNAFNFNDIYQLHGDAVDDTESDARLNAIKSIEINDNQVSSPRWEQDLKRKYSIYCHLSQLPPWYESYDWILQGYRYNNMNKTWTPLEATKSIFAFHNETGMRWIYFFSRYDSTIIFI